MSRRRRLPAAPIARPTCPFLRGTALARAWHRAMADGTLTVWAADAIAVGLGTHPVLLWGWAWLS